MKKKEIEFFQNYLMNWRENLIRQADGTVTPFISHPAHRDENIKGSTVTGR